MFRRLDTSPWLLHSHGLIPESTSSTTCVLLHSQANPHPIQQQRPSLLGWHLLIPSTAYVFLKVFLLFSFLETGSHYVAQAVFELVILLPQPLEAWDYRCIPLCPAKKMTVNTLLLNKKSTEARCRWLPPVNPSYLGGWDQEDCVLRPAWVNSSWDLISKITRVKWTGGVAPVTEHLLLQAWSPEFKHRSHQN
jgi:hypothetical protein